MKFQNGLKKIIDFLAASMGLLILSPLFLLVAILIKLESEGPVFFRQERTGKDGKIFRIWKFRSMIKDTDKIEEDHALSEKDPWITRVGKLLREWTIDEWPQLINVLIGEMSLVGPRPAPPYQAEAYNDFQRKRLSVLPGMVSLVDIKGRNLVDWEKRFKIDDWYINNWSLWLDFKILFLTPHIVFSRKGVYGKGGVNKPFSKQ